MNKNEIRTQIVEVARKYAVDKLASTFEKNELKSYHILSANLLKFMPDISASDHKNIYQNLLKLKILENIPEYFKTFDLNNFFANLSPDKFSKDLPTIYISYHLGAFRTAILPMVKNNINIVIVIDSSIYPMEDLEKSLGAHFSLAKEIFPTSTTNLKILASNNKNTIIELMDKINKNYSILTYIDWSSGFDNNNTSSNVVVNFFNEKISVRQSLAYLSFYSKCPIVPLISYYSEDYEPNWVLFDSINPSNFLNVQEYTQYTMQQLFMNLEGMILKHYSQWQGWFHIHKLVLPQKTVITHVDDFTPNIPYKLNDYSGLFIIQDSYFVINKLTYKIVKLTKELYDILFSGNRLNESTVDLKVLKQLYNNGIIVGY